MAAISKNIFVVTCNKSIFEDSFSRKRNSDIINYHEIKKRLTNNDVLKSPPSDDVIEFQIIKKLNAFIKCRKTEFLFFHADEVDYALINNLKTLFSDCEYPVHFHLLVDDSSTIPKCHAEFNSVQTIDK